MRGTTSNFFKNWVDIFLLNVMKFIFIRHDLIYKIQELNLNTGKPPLQEVPMGQQHKQW